MSSLRCQSSDGVSSNLPGNLVGRPVDCIGDERILIALVWAEGTTVIEVGLAFAKVVGLDLGVVSTQPLEVDLVQVIRLQNHAAHDTLSSGRLQRDIHSAKHDVEGADDGGSIFAGVDRQRQPIATGGGVSLGSKQIGDAFREVDRHGRAERWIRGACYSDSGQSRDSHEWQQWGHLLCVKGLHLVVV